MAEGAGLRWWQEETPASTAYAAPVLTTPPSAAPAAIAYTTTTDNTPLDVWDELEAEARARVVAENRGERIVLPYHNGYNAAWRKEHLRNQFREQCVGLLIQAGIFVLIMAFQFIAHHRVESAVVGMLVGATLSQLFTYTRSCVRTRHLMAHQQIKPAVVLAPEGIAVHTSDVDIDLIRWQEIKDIKATTTEDGKTPCVVIVPQDAKALARRLGKRKIALPIRISQRCLPLTAEALVARIAAFEAGGK